MLNFIAADLQLYKIFKIMQVSFFGTQCVLNIFCLHPSLPFSELSLVRLALDVVD